MPRENDEETLNWEGMWSYTNTCLKGVVLNIAQCSSSIKNKDDEEKKNNEKPYNMYIEIE